MNFTVPPTPQKWIEVIPYGLVGGMAPESSLIVFKEKKGERRFAVWLSQLQSQVAIQQGLREEETFSFLNTLLSAVDAKPKNCYFVKNSKGEQFVKLQIKGLKSISLNLKASECLSFCIYHNCRFYCTAEFIESMKELRVGKQVKNIKRSSSLYLN